jgi:hypothetical protein
MDEHGRCIVVLTDETGRYDASVEKALGQAGDGARVILYDVTAPGSAFSAPRPTVWAGEGAKEMFEHPLDPVALERLGRHTLALQVQRARERGIDAYGWLPDHAGGDALAAYAEEQGAHLVLMPTDLHLKDIDDYFAAEPAPGITVERV